MGDTPAGTPHQTPGLVLHCLICGTALGGAWSYLFRVFGISRSPRNPNLCNRCNTHAEEGRVVELTVLFADLTAFTELTHELGPERTHEVVHAFLQMATRAVVEHDGFIDKYVGDAVMALFNAPIRRADHAALALAAALHLQAGMSQLRPRFGLDLQAGIGVASGWARVGRLGSTDRRDYTAVGNVVNLAARLEGQARPGEVVVDEAVYAKVAADFPEARAESLGLKGFRDPVPAYRLCAAEGLPRPAPGSQPARGRVPRLGVVIFAILGAPCAAATLLGPLAVALGVGGLFGATSAFWILDAAPLRIPVLTLATLGALANLYAVWHARGLRRQAEADGNPIPITALERRRTALVGGTSAAILLIVAVELYAHGNIMGHAWP